VVQRSQRVGLATAAMAPFLVGTGVAASSLLTRYPVFVSQGARYLLGALLLLVVFRHQALHPFPTKISVIIRTVVMTLFGLVIFSAATIEALRFGTIAGVGVIVGLVPIVLAIVGSLAQHERPGVRLLGAAAIVVLGATLVNGFGAIELKGVIFAVIAMACDATFSVMSASLVKELGAYRLAFYATALAGVIMIAIGSGSVFANALSGKEIFAILYVAVAVSFGSFVLWYKGLAAIGVARAGLFVSLIPVGALIGEEVLDPKAVSVRAIVGVAIVVAGLVYTTATQRLPDAQDGLDFNRGAEG